MASEKDIQKLELDMSQVARTTSILNSKQINKIWTSTPRSFKYTRPAKGGGNWTYVKVSYIRKVLDSITGFNWDFDIETSLAEAWEVAKLTKQVVVKGRLTIRVKHDGQWVSLTKTQFGRADVKFKKNSTETLDIGNDFKSATSDCLKKCASLLGIAADVYEAEEFQDINVTDPEEKKNQVSNLVDKAKKELSNV
jgi:hypothetical protein